VLSILLQNIFGNLSESLILGKYFVSRNYYNLLLASVVETLSWLLNLNREIIIKQALPFLVFPLLYLTETEVVL
jgi:hypothetical protein